MELLFLNKRNTIAKIEYYEQGDAIVDIHEMYDIKYAPFSVEQAQHKNNQSVVKALNHWYRERSIPSWRKGIHDLLNAYQDIQPKLIFDKGYGLSLSDQYWFKTIDDYVTWDEINFFYHNFLFGNFYEIQLGSKKIERGELNLSSPNITTDGMLPKCWAIEGNKRILVKGTYTESKQEPFNEWLASQIAKRLGFDYINYNVEWNGTEIVSKCENFIHDYEELVPAYDLFTSKKKPNNINDYEHYISILDDLNIANARQNVANTFIVDYLTLNYDRHLKNFGVIRNVDTLKWEKVTPIYDTGQSMQCNMDELNMNFMRGRCKFFTNPSKNVDDMLWTLGFDSLKNIDFYKLEGLDQEFEQILKAYQDKTMMSDIRIKELRKGLNIRISRILGKMEQMKRKQK